jgi:hypothetical protein
MPTNANTFNSRVTSEALEAKFRNVFPAQGGAELVQDLYASGVIQPVIDFSAVAEGSALRSDLQSAWDFGTGHQAIAPSSTTAIVSNTGFWKVSISLTFSYSGTTQGDYFLFITDGSTSKRVWSVRDPFSAGVSEQLTLTDNELTVFLRSGDSLNATTAASGALEVVYRQIADVYGNLTNPTGYTSS